jgi:hypothetical protein
MKFIARQRVIPGNLSCILIRLFLIPVVIIFLKISASASATDISVAMAVGHDDNPTQSPEPISSMFSLYRIGLSQPFFVDSPLVDSKGYIGSKYQDYFNVKDNYQIYAGGSFAMPLADGRLVPDFFYEGTIFRDNELPADSMNEHCLGGRLEWLPYARLTLEIQQTLCWQNYINEDDVYANGGPKNINKQDIGQQTYSRDDRLYATGFLFYYNFTPETDAELLFTHDRLSSTIAEESHVENGVKLSLLWEPLNIWEISGTISWDKSVYDDPTDGIDRQDTAWNIGAGISRLVGQYELFFRVNRTDNNSSLSEETYTNMVTLCGVSRSF